MKLTVELEQCSYDIILERGAINHLADYLDLDRKVLIVSDIGVPRAHINAVLADCKHGYVEVVDQGEGSKSFRALEQVLGKMLDYQFTRKDLVIALGGGVVGDLSGLVAATYMRGVDFVNIPTTTLSQIDSSIGGKVAINLAGVKNVIGAFYQPKCVIIDSDTLSTLPERHFVNGLVEAIKAGLIYDPQLFELFEKQDIAEHLDDIIYRALLVKKSVVEQDEKEQNLRKILNFGHTLGHGIESLYGLSEILHGEAVAMGMLPMITDLSLRKRVEAVYQKLGLKSSAAYSKSEMLELVAKDKKAEGELITIVKVEKLGTAVLEKISLCDILKGE